MKHLSSAPAVVDEPVVPSRPPIRLLSPKETADRLGGIPIVRLDRWRKEGRIAYVQLTMKSVGYPEDAVQAFIESCYHPAWREPAPTGLNRPKSAEHKRRIAESQKEAWAKRKKAGAAAKRSAR